MILAVITGMFKEFFFVFSIIIIHELGHLTAALYYKWELDKIAIYPFGGCVKFNEQVNKKIKEELLILITGPVTQIIFFFIVNEFSKYGLMTYRNLKIFETYHYTLLVFNLMPIYPLDGGRILNLVLNYIFPYKRSNKITIVTSLIIIVFLLTIYKNLNFTMMGIMLITEIMIFLKRQPYLYNKMLLERYLDKQEYKKFKIIKNKNSMYKDKRHIILYKNKYITEKDYLNRRFKVIK